MLGMENCCFETLSKWVRGATLCKLAGEDAMAAMPRHAASRPLREAIYKYEIASRPVSCLRQQVKRVSEDGKG